MAFFGTRIRFLHQGLTAFRIGLRGLSRRAWSSLNTVFSTAMVVGVLVVLLSIGAGYEKTLKLTGGEKTLMVLQAGSTSEMESSLSAREVNLITRAPALLDDEGESLAAGEVYAIANLERASDGKPMNVAVRGLHRRSLALRSNASLIEGRMFRTGRREIVVGRMAQQRFGGLSVGSDFDFAGSTWKVVGAFEADGSVAESEIWADAPMIQSAYSRGDTYDVVLAPHPSELRASRLEAGLNGDPRLNVRVLRQADYYADQADSMQSFVRPLAYGISGLMSLGAIFAALNTGIALVKSRAKELATLASLGWSQRGLMLSVGAETLALSLLGAVVGSTLAYVIFDGRVISTLFYSKDFSQVVFSFTASPAVLAQAALAALAIGMLGIIGPALQVRRLPVSRILANRR